MDDVVIESCFTGVAVTGFLSESVSLGHCMFHTICVIRFRFSLALNSLGWKAELTLDDMCRDLWNWQTKNPMGYTSAKEGNGDGPHKNGEAAAGLNGQ